MSGVANVISGRMILQLQKRVTALEVSTMRAVMEENPNLHKDVLKTFDFLQVRLSGDQAIKEARRLHGLDP